MKVLNVIWAFGTGGIGKLFLTYAALGEYDLELQISSVCIDLQNCEYDRKPLTEAGIRVIAIKNRKDMSWVKRLGGIAREVKPDVVFCHGFNGPVVIKLVACLERSLRVPMVCTYHGLYNPPTEAGGILQTPLINCKPGCIKDLHERWFWWRNIADCTCWSAKCPKANWKWCIMVLWKTSLP